MKLRKVPVETKFTYRSATGFTPVALKVIFYEIEKKAMEGTKIYKISIDCVDADDAHDDDADD